MILFLFATEFMNRFDAGVVLIYELPAAAALSSVSSDKQ